MKPLISVISVNYNGYDLTCAMIDSLRRHVTTPLEIVIVDNGSTRDEAAPLRERYPDVKVLRSERNLGFAGGNNLAAEHATGRFLLLLNPDTLVLVTADHETGGMALIGNSKTSKNYVGMDSAALARAKMSFERLGKLWGKAPDAATIKSTVREQLGVELTDAPPGTVAPVPTV